VSGSDRDITATPYQLDHVGVAVPVLADAQAVLTRLGYTVRQSVLDPRQRSWLAIMEHPGHPRIELVAPAAAQSPTSRMLARFGERAYHLCYRVTSLSAVVAEWVSAGVGFHVVSEPTPTVAPGHPSVQFFFVTGVGLVELLEVGVDPAAFAPVVSAARVVQLVADMDRAERFFAVLGYRRRGAPSRCSGSDGQRLLVERSGTVVLELVRPGAPDSFLGRALGAGGPRPLVVYVSDTSRDLPSYLRVLAE